MRPGVLRAVQTRDYTMLTKPRYVLLSALFVTASFVASKTTAQTVSGGKLPTRWSTQVSTSLPLPEYPRPQFVRKRWLNLNGPWQYATSSTPANVPQSFPGSILVPYPLESALSGAHSGSIPTKWLWYKRTFTVPSAWNGSRVLLHFGAVNWDSSVLVNGQKVASHRGGYDGFDTDITSRLKSGENELVVSVSNPLLADDPANQILGKQRLHPEGIFYTAATGIWRTVWLEPVATAYIKSVRITPNIDSSRLTLSADVENGANSGCKVQVSVLDGSSVVATGTSGDSGVLDIAIPSPKLWTPDTPNLYGLHLTLTKSGQTVDRVDSYFAMRKVSLGKDDNGTTRILLNNKFVFEVGALDQGYWPDGIYTAPTDSALRYDIEAAKKFGLNLLRKHAKVEPDRWYYWADKVGMLVWQDMPQGYAPANRMTSEVKKQFETELRSLIAGYYNHPSIIVWTTFNEGWGQHDTAQVVDLVKQLDPTRLVNNASGWTDMKCGDIADTHDYPGPGSGPAEATRASVNGEFGGVTMRVPGHMWTDAVMGYGATLKDAHLVTKRYQALLKKAYELRDSKGTSAVVYTQLTDVEQESNGLMTYDRAIIKPDVKILTAANQGQFPPLPAFHSPDLVPTSLDEPQTWNYTIDRPNGDSWTKPGFDSSGWKSGPAGFGHEVGTSRTPWRTDDIWIRREFTLPLSIPAKLAFNCFHDEDVEIYLNGVLAGTATGYVGDYVTITMNAAGRAALKPGKNLITVHCHQTIGGQFIDVGIVKE